ncbi:MAG: hypoxanthine-guanine phosphoribosyltransferase [Neisseriaceae bacterium]
MNLQEVSSLLNRAELLCEEAYCESSLRKVAKEITNELRQAFPLVISVMEGGVVFTGKLLPLLNFPLDFDYVHVSRYQKALVGSTPTWFRCPGQKSVHQRTVLVIDDLLDEGKTLLEIKKRVLELGASNCYTAVFANKILTQKKALEVDFFGLEVPDRYVFGYGMDVKGYWRNLPAIYAL